MWDTIKELKENKFFKKRLAEIKGKYDKYFSQTALTATQFNKQTNQNFAFNNDKESKSQGGKTLSTKHKGLKKRRKLNHENLYYNSQKRNYFNVYKNNFAIYFDQTNFKSIHKYYSKINEKKNLNKITIDLIKKRVHQKLYSILIDIRNSPEKAQFQSSPKILNNNNMNNNLKNNKVSSIFPQADAKKRSVFYRLKSDLDKKENSNSNEKNYNIIRKTYAVGGEKEKLKGEKNYYNNFNSNNKENLIKKINYPSTNNGEEIRSNNENDFILRPTIIKECDDFVTKTLMDKMNEFKFTFTENISNRLNIKQALKKLKFLDKKSNYNDFMDEIYSTDNVIENYNKNKFNIKILKRDKLAELKKKKTDFYQNIVDNRRALLDTPSSYYVRLERNKLGVRIGIVEFIQYNLR